MRRIPMMASLFAHRLALVGVVGALCVAAFSAPGQPPAAPPPPGPGHAGGGVNQALVDAANKEGTVVWYTSVDTSVAELVAKKFEARYSGIKVDVNRSGSERGMQRAMQEA